MRKVTLSHLTPARRRLIEVTFYKAYFGQILNLIIKDGEPVFEPPPEIYEEFKVGTPRKNPQPLHDSTLLTKGWLEFFQQLDQLQNGMISRVDVADGEPRKVRVIRRDF